MKKIFTTLGILGLIILLFSYTKVKENTYSIYINMNSFLSDTVLYSWEGKEFRATDAKIIKVELDYTELNEDDATFSIGLSDFGNTYNLPDTIFPYTMSVTADTIRINSKYHTFGEVKASFMFSIVDLPSDYFAIKLSKGSITTDCYLKAIITEYK